METERILKQEIIKSANSVKRKVKQIQDTKADNNFVLDTMFKPITQPLNQIASNNPWKTLDKYDKKEEKNISEQLQDSSSSDYEQDEDTKKHDRTILDYSSESEDDKYKTIDTDDDNNSSFKTLDSDNTDPSRGSLSWSMTSDVYKDAPFGVRIERGKHFMGTARINISDHSVTVAGQKYIKTPGLSELLFKKTPDHTLIRDTDLENYKLILLATNAHRRDFDPKKPIKSNKGRKYLNIIKPMFKNTKSCATSTESLNLGFGLPSLKLMKKNTDYIYWDDPNELVDRLKLLIASRDAGNTGLDNEILSILEELRESGIIN